MKEQTGAWNHPQQPRRQHTYIPADVLEDDDALYVMRSPSSVRRYASTFPTSVQPRVAIRVTRHQGPPPVQRASRLTTADPQTGPARQQAHWRLHWLNSVGLGMLATLMLAGILSPLWQWWHGEQDSLHYGYPRTFQCDQDVRHGGVSHFIAENLNGHIFIIEMQPGDLTRTKIYQGPTIFGQQPDLQPVTITFQDVNGDGYPDLLITVNQQRYIFINDHTAFRPATPADKINGGG